MSPQEERHSSTIPLSCMHKEWKKKYFLGRQPLLCYSRSTAAPGFAIAAAGFRSCCWCCVCCCGNALLTLFFAATHQILQTCEVLFADADQLLDILAIFSASARCAIAVPLLVGVAKQQRASGQQATVAHCSFCFLALPGDQTCLFRTQPQHMCLVILLMSLPVM